MKSAHGAPGITRVGSIISTKRYFRLLLAAIVLLAALLRIYQLGRESLYFDELYTVWAIRLPLGSLMREVPASGHPPLYYLVAHFWFMLGNSDAWVRSLAWAAGVGAVGLMYLTGKELVSRKAGLAAAALSAVSPFLVWESRIATDYSWMIAFAVLSLYMLVRSERRGGWLNWTGYVVATAAALLSHYYNIFLIVAEVPFFLFIHDWKRNRWRWPRAWLISQASVLAATVLIGIYSSEAIQIWHGAEVAPGLSDFVRGITQVPTVLIRGYIDVPGGHLTNRIIDGILVFTAGLLAVFSRGFRSRIGWKLPLALGIFVFITVAGPITVQLFRGDVLTGRYYAVAEPPLLLLAAIVIVSAPRRIAAVFASVLLAGLLTISIYTVEKVRFSDVRGVLGAVSAQEKPGDWLLGFPVHHFVVASPHYMSKPLPVAGGNLVPGNSAVFLGPPGKIWHGYHADANDPGWVTSPFTGQALAARLNSDLAAAARVWVIAGDGTDMDYVAGNSVYQGLAGIWTEVESEHIAPFILKLYVRRATPQPGAAAG